MKNLLTKAIAVILAVTSFHQPCKGDEFDKELEVFLVISSFNPDTERTLGFINELSQTLQESYPAKHVILIEDLAAKSFSGDSHWWKGRVKRLISRYKDRNLKAIIAIGQEAWAALSSQDSIPGKLAGKHTQGALWSLTAHTRMWTLSFHFSQRQGPLPSFVTTPTAANL